MLAQKTVGILVVLTLLTSFGCAKGENGKKKAAEDKTKKPALSQTVQQEKDVLIANVNALRNQEIRIAVVQQLLTTEAGKLRRLQAVFCDQYKLDPEKFRAGKYQYDEKAKRFVEKP